MNNQEFWSRCRKKKWNFLIHRSYVYKKDGFQIARRGHTWPELAGTGRKWPELAGNGRNWPKRGQKWPEISAIYTQLL